MGSFVYVKNLDHESPESVRVALCRSFLTRLRGLMFRTALAENEGALLVGDRDSRLDAAIHMIFVPFDLAVFWIDSELQVVDKVIAKAWRAAYLPKRPARYVLELHSVHYAAYEVGDKVRMVDA